jgi:hypothetical protein
MKKMRPGEIRFIARQIDKLWRVYDKARGSYPYHMPELGGEILQDTDKSSAEAEAERLNEKYGPKLEQKKPPKKKVEAEETVEADPPVDIPELPDYGEPLTEEEAARYEDGLMEEVKY